MRIAINAVAMEGGGGQTYLLNILQALSVASPEDEFLLFVTPKQRSRLSELPPRIRTIVCGSVPAVAPLRLLWEQTVLPVLLHRYAPDLLYAAFNTAALAARVPIVLLSHNATAYSSLPLPWSPYGHARNAVLRMMGSLSARVARTVVFVSHTSARVMAPQMGLVPSRVRVVHHGWRPLPDPAASPKGRWALPSRYILCVSDFYPYKNLECLLETFDRMASTGLYSGDLVLVGGEQTVTASYAKRLYRLRERLTSRERIRFIGKLPYEQMGPAYKRADLFVFPSLLETFGLPLLEAMGAGVPVVTTDWRMSSRGETADCNVGPEICGDAAVFFDPLSSVSLEQAMLRVICDSALRQTLITRGLARAKEFSWDRAATELKATFHEAVV
jgi:glycosyltransferase involved in cell wall biosynthesis